MILFELLSPVGFRPQDCHQDVPSSPLNSQSRDFKINFTANEEDSSLTSNILFSLVVDTAIQSIQSVEPSHLTTQSL